MKSFCVAILCLLVAASAVSGQQACTDNNCVEGGSTVSLVYHAGNNVGADFKLECGTGDDRDGFRVTVTAQDANPRSVLGYVKVGEQSASDSGSAPVVFDGSLKNLQLSAGNPQDCEENEGITGACKAKFTGTAEVSQYVLIPGSKGLYWIGKFNVGITCHVTPVQPEEILPTIGNGQNISLVAHQCLPFNHTLIITPIPITERTPGTQSYTVEIKAVFAAGSLPSGADWTLQQCSLVPVPQSAVAAPLVFINNGRILDIPQIEAEGERLRGPTRHQLTLDRVTIDASVTRLECQIKLCAKSAAVQGPACPAFGKMEHQTVVARGLSHSLKSTMVKGSSAIIQQGSVTLVTDDGLDCEGDIWHPNATA